MPKKRPAIQFYTGDWLKSPDVSKCSPATRGIWVDCLCYMHEAGESGEISGTMSELARLCRCSELEMETAISELKRTKTAEVTKRDADVTLVNRRMNDAYNERNSARKRKRKQREKKAGQGVTEKSRPHSSSSTSSSEKECDNARSDRNQFEPKPVKLPPMLADDPRFGVVWSEHLSHFYGVHGKPMTFTMQQQRLRELTRQKSVNHARAIVAMSNQHSTRANLVATYSEDEIESYLEKTEKKQVRNGFVPKGVA